MAVDHCAYFAHANVTAETYSDRPPALPSFARVVLGLFTNLASPMFWCLAGVSIVLLSQRDRQQSGSLAPTLKFLLVRAGILFCADIVLTSPLWDSWHPFHYAYDFELLSSLAVGMLFACGLLYLRTRTIAILALGLLLANAVVTPWAMSALAHASLPARIWATFGTVTKPGVVFPILGWFPLMVGGFAAGRLLVQDAWRTRHYVYCGGALLAVYLISRTTGFGSFSPFRFGDGWRGVLIMSKGPPGLDYLAFNLGWASLATAVLCRLRKQLHRAPLNWLVVFGQAPLFFYFAHLVIYRLFAWPLVRLMPHADSLRYGLCWLAGMIVLLPASRAYRALKVRHPGTILHYL